MSENNIVKTIVIHEGMKIFMVDEKSFLDVDKYLNEHGFTTRCNEDQWSIYIVSAPYEYNETLYRIK